MKNEILQEIKERVNSHNDGARIDIGNLLNIIQSMEEEAGKLKAKNKDLKRKATEANALLSRTYIKIKMMEHDETLPSEIDKFMAGVFNKPKIEADNE